MFVRRLLTTTVLRRNRTSIRSSSSSSSATSTSSGTLHHRDPPRPFRVLGIQQIAVGGHNKKALAHLWIDLLGLEYVGTYRNRDENVDEDIVKTPGPLHVAVEIDLMEPLDSTQSPKVHTPALNHVGLWVDDLHRAVTTLTEQGMRFTPGGIRQGAAGYNVAFIHPKGTDSSPLSGEGVLIELVQAPPTVIVEFQKQEQQQQPQQDSTDATKT